MAETAGLSELAIHPVSRIAAEMSVTAERIILDFTIFDFLTGWCGRRSSSTIKDDQGLAPLYGEVCGFGFYSGGYSLTLE